MIMSFIGKIFPSSRCGKSVNHFFQFPPQFIPYFFATCHTVFQIGSVFGGYRSFHLNAKSHASHLQCLLSIVWVSILHLRVRPEANNRACLSFVRQVSVMKIRSPNSVSSDSIFSLNDGCKQSRLLFFFGSLISVAIFFDFYSI